jgi:hypothetical protein
MVLKVAAVLLGLLMILAAWWFVQRRAAVYS